MYGSKDWMQNYTDDERTISAKSSNAGAQQRWQYCWHCGVRGGTILLNGVGTIFPACRRRKRGDDAGVWLGRLATDR